MEEQIAGGDKRAGWLEPEHRELSQPVGRAAARSRRRRRTERATRAASRRPRQPNWRPPPPNTAGRHDRSGPATSRAVSETEAAVAELEARLAGQPGPRRRTRPDPRDRASRETGDARVELASSEQQLDHLRTQRRPTRTRPARACPGAGRRPAHLALGRRSGPRADRNILTAESAVAELFLRKEVLTAANVEKINRREASRQLKAELAQEAQRTRARIRKVGNPAARQGTGGQRSAARTHDPGRPPARGLRHRPGRARRAAYARGTGAPASRSRPKSPTCGRRSTASAA